MFLKNNNKDDCKAIVPISECSIVFLIKPKYIQFATNKVRQNQIIIIFFFTIFRKRNG
jgi:hypothetical protein